MRETHSADTEKQPSLVTTNTDKRLNSLASFLVRDGSYVSIRDIPSVLGHLMGTQSNTTKEMGFVRRLHNLMKDDTLTVLVNLVNKNLRSEGSDVVDCDVKLVVVKFGCLKDGHVPTLVRHD